MKNYAAPLLALLLGVAAGLGGMYQLRAGEVSAARDTQAANENALQSVRDELAAAHRALADLEAENERLRADEESTNKQLAALRAQAETPAPNDVPPPTPPSIGMETLLSGLLGPEPRERGRGNGDEDVPGGRDRWGGEERATEFRERVRGYLDQRIANAQTAAEQERLTAFMEYADYLGGLRENMRNAQTDEEREQAHQAFFEGLRGMRQLMEEQRDASIASVAARYGITDLNQQQAFISQMEDVMRDPLSGGGFMGGPPGGFRGGPPGGGFSDGSSGGGFRGRP